jgi:hypothetical protein
MIPDLSRMVLAAADDSERLRMILDGPRMVFRVRG